MRGIALGLLTAVLRLSAQITEVPATVAPGQFLLEADVVSLQIDREGEEKYSALGLGSVLVTTGLSERLDLQVGADIFVTQKYEAGEFAERHSGVGDLYFRAKWRFFESPESAAAVIPYVKVPTNSGHVGNDAVEGGVIVPYETKLMGGFLFNAQVGLDLLRNADDSAYDMNWAGTLTLSRNVTSRISVYGEALGEKSSGASDWIGTIGGGVYLTLSDRFAWDLAVYRGLSRAATDWNPVVRLNVSF